MFQLCQSIFFFILFLHMLGVTSAAKFTFINQCTYTIWPATLTSAGTPVLPAFDTGFQLLPGDTNVLDIPTSWSGRMWARTHCTTDPAGKNFSCGTGDCGTGSLECTGSGALPPASLAEFTLNGSDGLDFYDVSLVDGYNLPITVRPVGGSGNCSSIGCTVDLNGSCPTELRLLTSAYGINSEGVGCKSACEAFGDPQYCCSGPNATPDTCKPSKYSEFFKAACPTAYSYAYDDATSTFTCHGADYVISFCPSVSATGKSSGTRSPEASGPPRPPAFPPNNVVFVNTCNSLMSSSIIGLITTVVWLSLYLS